MDGAQIAMSAIGPQDLYVWGQENGWMPNQYSHTPFVISQRFFKMYNLGGFLGNTINIDLNANDLPDLLSNMHLKFSLPINDANNQPIVYSPMVGRAIIDTVKFIVDGKILEQLTDDWYIIRDELFLDADQKLAMYSVTGPATTNSVGGDYIVPLEFFFCQRKGSKNPYFPICATHNSKISIVFSFINSSWVTQSTVDLVNPMLILEGVTLSDYERQYYRRTPLVYKVPIASKESQLEYNNGVAVMHLTAKYPVSMMVWFIRNKQFETTDSRFFQNRYDFGYSTKYISSAVPVTFFDGTTSNYIDVIDQVIMYFNGHNILSNFTDGVYHSVVQPIDHGLSIPTKNMYMYCFTSNPTKLDMNGAVDFSQLDYKSTHIDISFLPQYNVQSNFSMNLYYYGYITLQIANGTVSFST
jgi:hypothetical protein